MIKVELKTYNLAVDWQTNLILVTSTVLTAGDWVSKLKIQSTGETCQDHLTHNNCHRYIIITVVRRYWDLAISSNQFLLTQTHSCKISRQSRADLCTYQKAANMRNWIQIWKIVHHTGKSVPNQWKSKTTMSLALIEIEKCCIVISIKFQTRILKNWCIWLRYRKAMQKWFSVCFRILKGRIFIYALWFHTRSAANCWAITMAFLRCWFRISKSNEANCGSMGIMVKIKTQGKIKLSVRTTWNFTTTTLTSNIKNFKVWMDTDRLCTSKNIFQHSLSKHPKMKWKTWN